MRPGAVLVCVGALLFALVCVVWLSGSEVEVNSGPKPAAHKPEKVEKSKLPAPAKEGPHPVAVCDETRHTFGTMKMFESGSHKYVVRNDGKAPLEIQVGETTCQCTIADKSRKTIAPGESTEVELSWTIKNPKLLFEHQAMLHTNDPKNAIITLYVNGMVGRDLIYHPVDNWTLGTFSHDEDARFVGYCYSDNHDSFNVTKAESLNGLLKIEVTRLDEEELAKVQFDRLSSIQTPQTMTSSLDPPVPQCGYKLVITPRGEIPVGQISEPIRVESDIEGTIPHETSVTGTKTGPLDFFALPGSQWKRKNMMLSGGRIESAKGKKLNLLVFVRGLEGEFTISDVKSDPPWLDVSLTPQKSQGKTQRFKLTVEVPPGSPDTVRTPTQPGFVSFTTSHPSAENVKLNVVFTVQN